MSITMEVKSKEIIIRIKGRLDRGSLGEFRLIYRTINSRDSAIVLDLKDTTFIDGLGLSEIKGMKKFLGLENGAISITHTSSAIKALLANIGFDRQFQIV